MSKDNRELKTEFVGGIPETLADDLYNQRLAMRLVRNTAYNKACDLYPEGTFKFRLAHFVFTIKGWLQLRENSKNSTKCVLVKAPDGNYYLPTVEEYDRAMDLKAWNEEQQRKYASKHRR